MSTVTIPAGSVEYLHVNLTADHQLDTQSVEVAVIPSGHPDVGDWNPATWVGAAGTTRTATVLLDGTLEVGAHYVYARLTDSPEAPIVNAGMLWVR